MRLYQIDTKYACFGIIEEKGKVIKSAPIAKWTIEKDIQFVLSYFKKKGAVIKIIEEVIY